MNVSKWVQNVNSTLRRASSSSSNQGTISLAPGNSLPLSYNQSWLHNPDVLQNAYVEYTVKFLGDVSVDDPKGTHAIKEAIHKLRFNLDWKRSQGVYKLPKVELHVSVKGVKIVDPKNHMVVHTHPLHRISFCADDKHDRRLFAFIAKQPVKQQTLSTSNPTCSQGPLVENRCFVFLSEKLAEHITLTIGQAFDLAYRQFLDANKSSKGSEDENDSQLRKLVTLLRKRVKELECENDELKQQLAQNQRLRTKNLKLMQVECPPSQSDYLQQNLHNSNKATWENFDSSASLISSTLPPIPSSPVPPPPQELATRNQAQFNKLPAPLKTGLSSDSSLKFLDDLMLSSRKNIAASSNHVTDETLFDSDFDPRRISTADLSPTNDESVVNGQNTEMSCEDLAREITRRDALLAEMRDGYRRGLCIGRTDFDDGVASVLDDAAASPAANQNNPH